jgi:O-antigen/teichoic acid export membrane protein
MSDRIFMTASVLIRMGAGLLVFVLLARGLGPVAFGLVATVVTYASLASMVADFGFASKTLRDIGSERDRGAEILSASLSVKLILTLVVAVVGAGGLLFVPGDATTRVAAGLLGLAILIGAVGDLALTAYRAVGRYSGEAMLTVWTSAVHLLVVGWVSLAHGGLLMLAIAFIASRVLYCVAAVIGAERLFAGYKLRPQPLRQVWMSIRDAWGWAADSGLAFLTGHIDGLVVAAIFGLQAAGVYQSGSRFVHAALALAAILTAIHIPRLAQVSGASLAISPVEKRMMLEFTTAGLALGLIFAAGGPLLTSLFLGPEYEAVNSLWAGFALFVAIRYAAASLGAALSARGLPLVRVAGQIAALIVVLAGFGLAAPVYGLLSAPWIMSAGALATLASYAVARLLVARGRLGLASPAPDENVSEVKP